MTFSLQVKLSKEDLDLLNYALGLAVSASRFISKDRPMALRIIELTNKINTNNPDWMPQYKSPDELLKYYENFEDMKNDFKNFRKDDSK